ARVWDPVRARLGEASLVLVVPDGALQLVSLASLPDARGWLVEHGPTLHTLTAERDVVQRERAAGGSGRLAVGAPDFGAGEGGAGGEGTGGVACGGGRRRGGGFDGVRSPPLPAAREEMDSVVALWRSANAGREPCSQVAGADANEARFKHEAPGHRVLHLATH